MGKKHKNRRRNILPSTDNVQVQQQQPEQKLMATSSKGAAKGEHDSKVMTVGNPSVPQKNQNPTPSVPVESEKPEEEIPSRAPSIDSNEEDGENDHETVEHGTTKSSPKASENTDRDDNSNGGGTTDGRPTSDLRKVLLDAQVDLKNAEFPGWVGQVVNPIRDTLLTPALGVCTEVIPLVSEKTPLPFTDELSALVLGASFHAVKVGYTAFRFFTPDGTSETKK